MVRIEVHAPLGLDVELGERLQRRFELDDAWVSTASPTSERDRLQELGRVGATIFTDGVTPDSMLGVSWGRTMHALVSALPTLPPCGAVQVAGGLPDDAMDGASSLIRTLHQRAGGELYLLHAPLVVADSVTASRLRKDPTISATLATYSSLTAVVHGVGAWEPETSLVTRVLSDRDRRHLRQKNAVAEVCGLFLAGDGEVVHGPLTERTLAINEQHLRAAPRVLAVAGGAPKAVAIRALLLSGLCTQLVTDAEAAAAMLAM
jgi:DNA-binding transcriptional regulator LsrR (DeoR family)